MATIPTVKASTQKKVRDIENVPKSNQLMNAIAATMQAGSGGRAAMSKISEKLQAQEKGQHTKDMKRKK